MRAEAREVALVDVCVSTVTHVGAKALWQPATLRELYCAFAEPHAIGLSSIAGLLHPAARTDPHGVVVTLAIPRPGRTVFAPIAPGVVTPIGVRDARYLLAGVRTGSPWSAAPSRSTASARSSSAPAAPVTVTLAPDGPRVLDVRITLADAAARRLLVHQPDPNPILQSAL